MKALNMVVGMIYTYARRMPRFRKGEFVFSRISKDGKWVIVHPPGEPDMQSSWGLPVNTEVVEIRREEISCNSHKGRLS